MKRDETYIIFTIDPPDLLLEQPSVTYPPAKGEESDWCRDTSCWD